MLGPGAYFGEVALVTGKPRTATVEAVEASRVLAIGEEEFDSVLDQNPKLAREIIYSLSQWLAGNPAYLLANHFGWPEELIARFPRERVFIAPPDGRGQRASK